MDESHTRDVVLQAMRDVDPGFDFLCQVKESSRYAFIAPYYWKMPRTGPKSRAAVLWRCIQVIAAAEQDPLPFTPADDTIVAVARELGLPI